MFQNLVQVSVSRRNFDFQAAGEIFSPKSIKEVLASISMYKWDFFGVEVCGKLILAYSLKRFNCVSQREEENFEVFSKIIQKYSSVLVRAREVLNVGRSGEKMHHVSSLFLTTVGMQSGSFQTFLDFEKISSNQRFWNF